MMELFDTHAHFTQTKEEIAAIIARAKECGVTRIMAVGGSEELNHGVALAAECSGDIYRAIGWDREQVDRDLPELDYKGIDAVGEIGLDYYYSKETRKKQLDLMAMQLEKASLLGLPVVIHTREADDDTLGLLRDIPSRGIIHCFTGSALFCRKLLDLGFYISYSGIVTFRLADNVRESAKIVPDDRILIETDSPYLSPVPLRGKTNEPSHIAHTARFLADLRKTPEELFAAITIENSFEILGRRK